MKQAAFALAFLALLSAPAFTQIPRTLSYQAVLTDNAGVPKPDGSYTITFRLYTSAAGGASLWSEAQTLPVKRGLFSAVLGSVTPIGTSISFDRQYWLSLQVSPDAEMAARLPLASVGYSFSALIADTARFSKGTVAAAPLALSAPVSNPNYVLSSTATGTGGGVLGVSDHGFGVVGAGTGATGVNYGVAGNSSSPDGMAVSGWNLATTGNAVGVRALTNSPSGWGAYASGGINGIGVVGQSLGTTGVNYGIAGNSSSPDGFAVSGRNLATTGNAVGVLGATNSSVGWGVYGVGGSGGIGVYRYWVPPVYGAGVSLRPASGSGVKHSEGWSESRSALPGSACTERQDSIHREIAGGCMASHSMRSATGSSVRTLRPPEAEGESGV